MGGANENSCGILPTGCCNASLDVCLSSCNAVGSKTAPSHEIQSSPRSPKQNRRRTSLFTHVFRPPDLSEQHQNLKDQNIIGVQSPRSPKKDRPDRNGRLLANHD